MKTLTCGLALATCFAAASTSAGQAPAADEVVLEPYPLDYWAMRAVISNVAASPDGKHLALMKIPSKDGDPIIEVYDAGDLSKDPFRLDADPMEITGFYWASDQHILFNLRQKVRDKIEGFNQGVYEFRLAVLDVQTKKLRSFESGRATVVHILPEKPNKVMLAVQEGAVDGPGSRMRQAFRPLAYYEFDLRRGSRKLILRGKLSLAQVAFDGVGNPRFARGFDEADRDFVWYWRPPNESGWTEYRRVHFDDLEFAPFAVIELDPDVPGNALVLDRNGEDTVGLWSYNLAEQSFSEAIYRRGDIDISGVRYHSNGWMHPDTVVGVSYRTDRQYVEYFDEAEGALYAQLEALIPHVHDFRITSRSRDGTTLTVVNRGPHDPGTYYLLKDGHFQPIGSQQPLLASDQLADVEYVTYKARDGRHLRAYITIPHGEAPFPAVVLPHGGPFARDYGGYDKWAQVLANQGYVVIQPQFRGSDGFGLDLYKAAFEDLSQQGHKMQDDKDDAALYLVARGLAVRDRLAMFGWSYGGYAALVAASRTPQLYQCVIAGAAVSDPIMQINYYRWQMQGEARERHLKFDDHAVKPVNETENVNVPILLIHGDVDQRVPVDHARKYMKQLDKHGKAYQYVELEGADHFYNTLFFNHQLEFFTAMTNFLARDCGPGGL